MTVKNTKIKRKLSPLLSELIFSFAEESSGILLPKNVILQKVGKL